MSKKKSTNAPRLMLQGLILTIVGAVVMTAVKSGVLHTVGYWTNLLGVFALIAGIVAWIYQKATKSRKNDYSVKD